MSSANKKRAALGRKAIVAANGGKPFSKRSVEAVHMIVDTLANVLHAADEAGHGDFAALCRTAQGHATVEIGPKPAVSAVPRHEDLAGQSIETFSGTGTASGGAGC